MMRLVLLSLLLGIVHAGLCQAPFTKISGDNSGMTTLTSSKGVAFGDFDNDGDEDLFVVTLDASESNRLYRNDGDLVFTDVTGTSGLQWFSQSQSAVWFDADNDGWLDLYIGDKNGNRFYHNQGDGTFANETQARGLDNASFTNGINVADFNGDGWLDIYGNNASKINVLFFNEGNGFFSENIDGSGSEALSEGMGSIAWDFDHDGDQDIYLVFDGNHPNLFFRNKGNGQFSDISRATNTNVAANGMGVDVSDVNNDGRYDLYITNLYANALFLQQNDGKFLNIARDAGVNDEGMSWGTFWFDYNNDMFQDIYVANEYGYSPFHSRLFRNNGNNTFSNVAVGTDMETGHSSYGAAWSDLNNDGKLDFAVANMYGGGVELFLNQQTSGGNWIQLTLVGTTSNKRAVGAHLDIKVEGVTLMRDIVGGSGYASQNSMRIHTGLANHTTADQIRVRWPDGSVEAFDDVISNNHYLIIQGEGITVYDNQAYRTAMVAAGSLPEAIPVTFGDEPLDPSLSVARHWNEELLNAIRRDLARPTVHARNLYHVSLAMYDAWAAYDTQAKTFFLGNKLGDFRCKYNGLPFLPDDIQAAREEALSYAVFRILKHRFANSPGAPVSLVRFQKLFRKLGYDENFISSDYSTGSPAALGNYIGYKLLELAAKDGSNELSSYSNKYYQSTNAPFNPINPGCSPLHDANRWQPIKLNVAIDQAGNPVSSTQSFLSAEWGNVVPFALTDAEKSTYTRDGHDYHVYYDPGQFPKIDTINGGGLTSEYIWNFSLVSAWASHLDPTDGVMIDVSPNTIGNIAEEDYPTTVQGLRNFYDLEQGGDKSRGYTVNPKTGQPYATQLVPRGDYTRVLAEYWADGPTSETPPGHWYSILNYVTDHPQFERRFHGEGEPLDKLEWDVKAYLTLGGAVHDAAISAWGIKGYYDGVRPVTAIRSLAERGQSSDAALPNYHPAGIKLIPGFIELVEEGDPLAGANNEHVGKVKLYTWRGPQYITNPSTDDAGAGWILGENWWPYQRPTFVTPPFAGYISGHSTYSSAGAQVMTLITGDEYFPGGLGEFTAKQNEYLVFEEGPSVDVKLQWAKYKDAADQCSLSRIWGGIHPPFDDMPGRFIGANIGTAAYNLAIQYFSGEIITDTETSEDVVVGVYPNPTQGVLTIELPAEWQHSELTLHDTMGRRVHAQSAVESVTTWNTSSLTKGLYILTIRTPRGMTISRKVVVR